MSEWPGSRTGGSSLPFREVLALHDAASAGADLGEALSNLVEVQALGVRALSGAGPSPASLAAYLDRTGEAIRAFASAFAAALGAEATGGLTVSADDVRERVGWLDGAEAGREEGRCGEAW